MLEVADYIAETSQTIGDSEERIKNVMISRRKFEYLMKQLKVIKALKNNKNFKVFGENKADNLTQMTAFRAVNNLKDSN